MNGFQILNKDKVAIPINVLDAEVAEMWNFKPQNSKEYAMPKSRSEFEEGSIGEFEYYSQSNWFDTIGFQISAGMSFQDIIDDLTETFKDFIGKTDEDGTVLTLENIVPEKMIVLKTWIEKGYIPMSI